MRNKYLTQKILVQHTYLPYVVEAIRTKHSTRFCIVPLEDNRTYRVIDTETGLCMSDANGYNCASMFIELLNEKIKKKRSVARAFKHMTWDTVLRRRGSKEGRLILATEREVRRRVGMCMQRSGVTYDLKFKHRPEMVGGGSK